MMPNSPTAILDALKEQGESVERTESLGLAGTLYHMTCGCVRSYSVDMNLQHEIEKLFPCDKHKALAS